jgi:ABC-type transporter Mla MlaB component
MLRAEFTHKNGGLALKLEGRLVAAWAVQVKTFVTRHFTRNGLLVDLSEVTYVDSIGEQLLLWLGGSQARFVAQTCYTRDVCERLHLTLKEEADSPVPSAAEVGPS